MGFHMTGCRAACEMPQVARVSIATQEPRSPTTVEGGTSDYRPSVILACVAQRQKLYGTCAFIVVTGKNRANGVRPRRRDAGSYDRPLVILGRGSTLVKRDKRADHRLFACSADQVAAPFSPSRFGTCRHRGVYGEVAELPVGEIIMCATK